LQVAEAACGVMSLSVDEAGAGGHQGESEKRSVQRASPWGRF
jgi:hypothetical protein